MARGEYTNKAAQNVAEFTKEKTQAQEQVVETAKEPNQETPKFTGKLKYEKKEKRISIVVSPAVHAFIEELRSNGEIKSANGLINELLEEYMLKQMKK